MAFKIYKFQDAAEMELFLNGALLGNDIRKGIAASLQGKTMVFTVPAAGTATFTDPPANGAYYTLAEIKAKLEAASAGLVVSQKDGRLVLKSTTGVSISSTSTGLAEFGFGPGAAVVAKVYGAPGAAAPSYVQAYGDAQGHILVVLE